MRGLRGLLLLVSTGRFLAFVARMNVVPFYPELMNRFHAGYTEVGALFSAFFIGYALSLVPAGIGADRWPALRPYLSGLFLMIISGAALALTDLFAVALAARVVEGVSVALMYTATLKILAVHVPRESRGRAMSIMEIAIGLGMYTSLTILPLLGRWADYRALLMALPAVAVGTLFLVPFARPRGGEERPEPRPLGDALRSVLTPNLLFITLSTLLSLFAVNGTLGWISEHLVTVLGFGRTEAGFIAGIVLLFQILGAYPTGWVSDRMGRRLPLVHLGTLLLMAGFLLLLFANTWLVYGAAALIGMGMALGITPLTVLATEQFGPSNAGMVSAITVAVAQAGSGFSGVLFGWVLDTTGNFSAVWLLAVGLSVIRLATTAMIRENWKAPDSTAA